METLTKWLPIVLPLLVLILQLLMGWAMWSLQQKFVSKDDCKQCKADTSSTQSEAVCKIHDLEKMEAASSAARVTTQDLGKIYERINTVDRKVSAQAGELKSIRANIALIHQHLLEK